MENKPVGRQKQAEAVKRSTVSRTLPQLHTPAHTYNHEEDRDAIDGPGPFLGVRMHEEHYDRSKDEEEHIAELQEKQKTGWLDKNRAGTPVHLEVTHGGSTIWAVQERTNEPGFVHHSNVNFPEHLPDFSLL